jgi:hypothetical protein
MLRYRRGIGVSDGGPTDGASNRTMSLRLAEALQGLLWQRKVASIQLNGALFAQSKSR